MICLNEWEAVASNYVSNGELRLCPIEIDNSLKKTIFSFSLFSKFPLQSLCSNFHSVVMFLDKSLLAIASLALVSAFPISERASCSSYTLISTRGTTELQGPSAGFRTMISQTLAAIPGGKEVSA